MTTAEMLQKIQTSLATNDDFISWCVAELGAAPTIQIDFDDDQELPSDCYPFIGLLAITHDSRIQQRENQFTVRCLAAVKNSELEKTTTETVGQSVNLRTFPGRLQAESLREQAISTLYRAQLGKVSVGSDDMSNTYHPKFYSPFTLTIEERI